MKFKSTLLAIAQQSPHHKYRHAAIVAKGKAIYGMGDNHFGHAETAALHYAKDHAYGAILYTLMVKNSGNIGNGSPCKECMKAIRKAGIRKVVVYT